MASNHQNSLGWIDLQLRAEAQKRQALEDQQIRADRREQEQTGVNNALNVANYELKSKDLDTKNKLALAGLMSRSSDNNQTKLTIEQMKELFGKPLQEATIGLKNAQKEDIPKDTTETERSHRANELNTAEGQKSSLLGQGLKMDNVYGGPGDIAAYNAMHSRLRLPPFSEGGSNPPGTTRIDKPTRTSETKEVTAQADMAPYFTRFHALVKNAPDDLFGLQQGGIAIPDIVPGIGGKIIPGSSTVVRAMANAGIGSKQNVERAKQQNEIEQAAYDLLNARVLEQTGKAMNKEETGRITQALGMLKEGVFANKKELLLPALEQAYGALQSGYARKNQQLQQGYMPGTLPDINPAQPATPQDPANIPVTRSPEDTALMQQVQELMAERPELNTSEAFQIVKGRRQ